MARQPKQTAPETTSKRGAKKEPAKVEQIEKARSAKEIICELIADGKEDEQIIAAVLKEIPDSKVDGKHCTKYRRLMFVNGEVGPAFAARNSTEYKEWQAEEEAKAEAAAKRGSRGSSRKSAKAGK